MITPIIILILKIKWTWKAVARSGGEKGSTRICIIAQAHVTQKVISKLKFKHLANLQKVIAFPLLSLQIKHPDEDYAFWKPFANGSPNRITKRKRLHVMLPTQSHEPISFEAN